MRWVLTFRDWAMVGVQVVVAYALVLLLVLLVGALLSEGLALVGVDR